MKAYQVKIILKNTKPPVWRRCLIPAGITFAQMALILDEITESEKYDGYEYEFYQAGIHVREWREGERQVTAFSYDYLCAPDTFIDTLADKETWFTFRPGDSEQYRVEIEKRLSEPILFPVIIKQKNTEISGWRNAETVNKKLAEHYPIHYGEADYRTFRELKKELSISRKGLNGACHPEDKTDRRVLSADSMVRSAADLMLRHYSDEVTEKLLKDMERQKDGGEPDADVLQSILEDTAWRMRQDIREKIFGCVASEEKSRQPDIKEFLLGATKEELFEMAADLKLSHYKAYNKNRLAEIIRDEILKPEIMKKRMLLLSDAEIQEFESAAAKENGFYPTPKEMKNLEKLYDLAYVMFYADDYAEVPKDAAEIYQTINTPAFQEKRRGTYWLYHCLMFVEMIYQSVPVRIISRILKKCLGRKVARKELEEFWDNIPAELNSCVLQGDRIICKEVLSDKLYLKIEEMQEGKDFYIPEPDEIIEYTENGYPVSDPYYRRLKTFLITKMDMDMEEVEEYMPAIWGHISMGASPSDIMEIFEEDNFVFPTDDAVTEFLSIVTDVNNHTRMVIHRGWTPEEIYRRRPPMPKGKRTTIVPMSSEVARLLGECSDKLKEMGVDVDFEHNADEITTMSMPDGIAGETVVGKKRIYPNDPCPCGSGKKYKKCCGRK